MTGRTTHRRSGYTLIELLIVVGILGLAGALLVPQMVNQESMITQAAVRRLIGDLAFAQADALAHQEFRRVHFYSDGRGYCLVRVNAPGGNFDPDTADYLIDPLSRDGDGRYIIDFSTDERYSGISIISTDIDVDDGADLYFDELGGTVDAANDAGIGGPIVIGSDGEQYEIDIAPFTGKLTVIKQ